MSPLQKYVGSRVRKLNDPPLATGKGCYVDDVVLPGMAYCAILRSPYARAKIKSVDVGKAARKSGVLLAVDGNDMKKVIAPIPYMYGYEDWGAKGAKVYSLAVDEARFSGEPVAAVVAEDKYTANDALSLIDVDYEPMTPVLDAVKALELGSPLVYSEWGSNLMLRKHWVGGDVESAFRAADVIIKDTLRIHRYTGTPLEPRGYVASYERATGILTFYASTQQPHPLRTFLSEMLGLSESKVRVIQPHVGGGFGLKIPPYQEEPLLAYLSIKLGRPVKWIEDRRENFLAGGHARQHTHHFEVAAGKDGKILGFKNRAYADVGVPSPLCGWGMAFVGSYHMPAVYKIENCDIELNVVVTNKGPWNAYRGYGKETTNFVMERVMDLVAKELNLDPAQVRMKNFVPSNEFPYRLHSGALLDSGQYGKVLEKALKLAKYDLIRAEQSKARSQGRYVGIGISYELTPEGACLPDSFIAQYDGTTVRVAPTGKVTVLTGITSPGTGQETSIAQVVADELGTTIEDITVIQGDTLLCPYGLGNFSGRSTLAGASSAYLAAKELSAKIRTVAAKMLEASPSDIEAKKGNVYVRGAPRKGISFSDVSRAIYRKPFLYALDQEPALESTKYWKMPNATHVPDEQGRIITYTSYPNGAHIAMVEVDIETGKINILKYVLVDDCGVQINPMIVEGQLHGGLAQGIGGALFEELVYDENGQLLTTTFMDYPIPTAMEMPSVEMDHEETPSPFSLLGTKGVGESGAVGAPAALVNAVEDALAPLGVKIRSSSLKPRVVWRLIQEAKARKGSLQD